MRQGLSTIVGMELRRLALQVLCLGDAEEKVTQTLALHTQAASLSVAVGFLAEPPDLPGRPSKPELLTHSAVARRSPATAEGRAVLLHAIAHIEFNAINLALDAVWRFADMPRAYYDDWMRVAAEEAQHFAMLRAHLRSMGHDYGDFPAHQGLWTVCRKTQHDIVARMALVPRTLEARGLDATPLIQRKLRQNGAPDALAAADILEIILREEVGHVAIGNYWYRWLCAREGLDPEPHYAVLAQRYDAPKPRPPFNTEARLRAGFTATELTWLSGGKESDGPEAL